MSAVEKLMVLALAALAAGTARAGTDVEARSAMVFVGDSITAGGDWQRLTGRADTVNAGVPAETTADILQRIGDVARPEVAAYFVMAGINDLAMGVPAGVIAANMRGIVDRLRAASPRATIVLQSTLPVCTRVRAFSFGNEDVVKLNERYRRLAADAGVVYVDLYPSFADEGGDLREPLTFDGLHLGADGYSTWAGELRKLKLIP